MLSSQLLHVPRTPFFFVFNFLVAGKTIWCFNVGQNFQTSGISFHLLSVGTDNDGKSWTDIPLVHADASLKILPMHRWFHSTCLILPEMDYRALIQSLCLPEACWQQHLHGIITSRRRCVLMGSNYPLDALKLASHWRIREQILPFSRARFGRLQLQI